jgi:glycosyltransferase involved in cell wall biosynthesis
VASDVGGVPTAVRHEFNGLLVSPENPAELASALKMLLDDPRLRRRMGDAGRDRFERDFTAAEMTRRYERLYERRPI